MALRIVIVGPGRVGRALGARFASAARQRVDLLGFVGRSRAAAEAACRFCGAGEVLGFTDLPRAHVVVFAVGDVDLPAAIRASAGASAPRMCSLWLHTSGRHGLGVFDSAFDVGAFDVGALDTGAPRGIRRGSLHPVAPIPDATTGVQALAGAPAVLDGEPRSERLLTRLCVLLGMVPVWAPGLQRDVYHAACALAANGLTALRSLVDRTFAAAGGLDAAEQRLLADTLMLAALRASSGLGPAAALSGPVRRGDAETVRAHVAALAASAPATVAGYRVLMAEALELAREAGLPPAAAEQLRDCLGPEAPRAR